MTTRTRFRNRTRVDGGYGMLIALWNFCFWALFEKFWKYFQTFQKISKTFQNFLKSKNNSVGFFLGQCFWMYVYGVGHVRTCFGRANIPSGSKWSHLWSQFGCEGRSGTSRRLPGVVYICFFMPATRSMFRRVDCAKHLPLIRKGCRVTPPFQTDRARFCNIFEKFSKVFWSYNKN